MFWLQEIITVEEDNDVPPRHFDPEVARDRCAAVRRLHAIPDARPQDVALHAISRSIRRTVVHHDDLEGRLGLSDQGVQRGADVELPVVGRDDDRNGSVAQQGARPA
jgi:hypothetical protein